MKTTTVVYCVITVVRGTSTRLVVVPWREADWIMYWCILFSSCSTYMDSSTFVRGKQINGPIDVKID